MALYHLEKDWEVVYNMLQNPEIDEQTVFDTLESIEYDIAEKAEQCGKMMRNFEAEEKALKDEEERLHKKRKQKEAAKARMKSAVMRVMETIGTKKLHTATFDYTIRDNTPSVNVLDVRAIPEQYLIPQDPSVDKKAISAALKAGEVVAGVELVVGKSLRMR